MSDSIDTLYRKPLAQIADFRFDAKVAAVFADMIVRSVPGYQQLLALLPGLVRQQRRADGVYYDLGCSLGAAMVAIAPSLGDCNAQLIGIDSSAAMLARAEKILSQQLAPLALDYRLECDDICAYHYAPAQFFLLNFTLQFIPLKQRTALLDKLYQALVPGGSIVISEKIKFRDPEVQRHFIDLHHRFKREQGYSALEISQKRDAIEACLVPETLTQHTRRLTRVGFRSITPWWQTLQFISILAIK